MNETERLKDRIKQLEKKYIKEHEMKEFKVGDWVSSKYFEGVKQIDLVQNNGVIWVDNQGFIDGVGLSLVCGFVKGEHVLADGDYERIFNQYRPELICPFECVNETFEKEFKNEEPYFVNHWSYAKPIEPKYKAYSEPKFEWIGEKVKSKSTGIVYEIDTVGKNEVTFLECDVKWTYEELLEGFTWIDGSVCGDKI